MVHVALTTRHDNLVNDWRRLVLVAVIALLAGCAPEPPQEQPSRRVYAVRVADASEFSKRAFPGRAKAAREVNQSFRVAGPLITFPVNVGDEVKQGDVVARIDPQDYERTLRTLEAQVEREEARRTRAEADLGRLENIYKQDPGATSEAAIDRARQVRDSASASVRSMQASAQSARGLPASK